MKNFGRSAGIAKNLNDPFRITSPKDYHDGWKNGNLCGEFGKCNFPYGFINTERVGSQPHRLDEMELARPATKFFKVEEIPDPGSDSSLFVCHPAYQRIDLGDRELGFEKAWHYYPEKEDQAQVEYKPSKFSGVTFSPVNGDRTVVRRSRKEMAKIKAKAEVEKFAPAIKILEGIFNLMVFREKFKKTQDISRIKTGCRILAENFSKNISWNTSERLDKVIDSKSISCGFAVNTFFQGLKEVGLI